MTIPKVEVTVFLGRRQINDLLSHQVQSHLCHQTVKNYEELDTLLYLQMNKLTCHSFVLSEDTRLLDHRQRTWYYSQQKQQLDYQHFSFGSVNPNPTGQHKGVDMTPLYNQWIVFRENPKFREPKSFYNGQQKHGCPFLQREALSSLSQTMRMVAL